MQAKVVAIRGALSLLFICQLGSYAVGQDAPGRGSATGEPPSRVKRPAEPTTTAPVNPAILSASDVSTAIANAAAAVSSPLVIAVTDRQGNILAVYRKANAPTTALGNFSQMVDANELAVGLAHTAGFFSNDQAPLSSRTVRYISGIHFPPGVMYTGPADLYGIENTNRGCPLNITLLPGQDLPPSRSIDGTKPGLGIQTGKADVYDSNPFAVNPGGVPLFKNGIVVGGIGVVGPTAAISEYAAVVAAVSPPFAVNPPSPGVVVIGGIALPFVNQTTAPEGPGAADGSYLVGPNASPAADPVGDLIAEHAGSQLTLADVQTIVQQAIATANITRAAIRLPLGARAKMVIAVADLDGSYLAIYRMPDATVFSVDVATAKARNVVYFSGNPGNDLPGVPPGTAVTNRAIYFASEPFFPPGIDYTAPGPFFPLYVKDVANPCTQGSQPPNPNQSGIVFFPGSVPLYKNGVLVGGLGISGDGVNQDDFVTAGGAAGYMAPANIRIDQIVIDGVRIPYQKFDRDPTQ
jgi:uncharacterized protein GlcG (DUF336 family)